MNSEIQKNSLFLKLIKKSRLEIASVVSKYNDLPFGRENGNRRKKERLLEKW